MVRLLWLCDFAKIPPVILFPVKGVFMDNRQETIKATGKCFICGADVPWNNVNKFYCSEPCRITAWRKYHPGEPEPDWSKIPDMIIFEP